MQSKKIPLLAPRRFISLEKWEKVGTWMVNIFAFGLLGLYLFPILFMVSTSFMTVQQLTDRFAPAFPGEPVTYAYQGEDLTLYYVPFEDEIRELALVNPGRQQSAFIDPEQPETGIIEWEGSWRTLTKVYRFRLAWENYTDLFEAIRFPTLIRNSLFVVAISEIGVLLLR